ncbi:MAG: MFS transporter [Planctomycetota bacterium]
MVNSKRLLWASFFSIFAAGVGFAIRGGILGDWAKLYGFTNTELGQITGGGLTGFGVIIILFSFIADRVGYGKLMVVAFVCHLLSAILTLSAGVAYASGGKDACFQALYWGMFLFAIGNGTCEAVVNPLVATLFPKEKTHYLNILHAGWPGGLILGGLASAVLAGNIRWEIQMCLFLVPTVLYGVMMLGQKFPISESLKAGTSFGKVLAEFAAPVLLFLLVIHAMVGYVELGTDSWIGKITGTIMASPQNGLLLFVYTSSLMFAMRFFAGPIVHRISPLGLLFVSGILGFLGLSLLGRAESVIGCVIAATVYACGKTFLWPTMLGVASEQFPRGGAVTLGMMGGIGMLSAGLLGGPGIGFKQDYFASQELQKTPAVYDRYKAENENAFLGFKVKGLDGAKVGVVEDGGKAMADDLAKLDANKAAPKDSGKELRALNDWWKNIAQKTAADDKKVVEGSVLFGSKQALVYTAFVPLTMAICYLLLLLYFKAKGGYKQVHIEEEIAAAGADM